MTQNRYMRCLFFLCIVTCLGMVLLYRSATKGIVKAKLSRLIEQESVLERDVSKDIQQMKTNLAELEQKEQALLALKEKAELQRQLTEKRTRIAELLETVESLQVNNDIRRKTEKTSMKKANIDNTDGTATTSKEDNNEHPLAARFRQRLEHLHNVCQSLPNGTFHKCVEHAVKGNLFNGSHDIVYCSVEKSGSTFWRRILTVIEKDGKVKDPLKDIGLGAAYSLSSLKEIELKEIKKIMSQPGMRNVVFVRDPYTRLFSGWLDKFYSTNPYWWGLGKKIIAMERQNASNQSLECGHDVTFAELVQFFVNDVKEKNCAVDGHFAPSYEHCLPCGLPYTFIGKYETLKEDTIYFLETANITHLVKFSNFETSSDEDAIKDSSKWAFGTREKVEKCIPFVSGLKRVWKRLQSRGILNMKAIFPEKYLSSANITESDFRGALLKAYRSFKIEDNKMNREIALREAYSTLSIKTLHELHEAFDLDFKLFDYDKFPSFITGYR